MPRHTQFLSPSPVPTLVSITGPMHVQCTVGFWVSRCTSQPCNNILFSEAATGSHLCSTECQVAGQLVSSTCRHPSWAPRWTKSHDTVVCPYPALYLPLPLPVCCTWSEIEQRVSSDMWFITQLYRGNSVIMPPWQWHLTLISASRWSNWHWSRHLEAIPVIISLRIEDCGGRQRKRRWPWQLLIFTKQINTLQ